MTGLDAFHAEISGRGYGFMRPGIEDAPWDARMMQVIDPFGNRIRFSEAKGRAAPCLARSVVVPGALQHEVMLRRPGTSCLQ